MEVIFNSFLLVAATEMGDKTQLLAFVLASRFRSRIAVLAGILVATLCNHALAAWCGSWVASHLGPAMLRWVLSGSFLAFAIWVLIPDKDESSSRESRFGAFLTTLVVFFLAEMGDKTQLSTVVLAARYGQVILVTLGTTLGMMLADGLAVFFGEKLTEKLSMKWIRYFSALLFAIFAVVAWIADVN